MDFTDTEADAELLLDVSIGTGMIRSLAMRLA
jgi:hypothetical protein